MSNKNFDKLTNVNCAAFKSEESDGSLFDDC